MPCLIGLWRSVAARSSSGKETDGNQHQTRSNLTIFSSGPSCSSVRREKFHRWYGSTSLNSKSCDTGSKQFNSLQIFKNNLQKELYQATLQMFRTFSIVPPAPPILIARSERTALYCEFQRRRWRVLAASAAFSDAARRAAKDRHAVTRLFSNFAPMARLPNPPLDSWSRPRHAPVTLVSKDMYAPRLPDRESVGS